MNKGHPQPPPTFACQMDPATGQVQVQTNITNPWHLMLIVGAALQATANNALNPPKPRLTLAREIPDLPRGPLRGDGPQEVS